MVDHQPAQFAVDKTRFWKPQLGEETCPTSPHRRPTANIFPLFTFNRRVISPPMGDAGVALHESVTPWDLGIQKLGNGLQRPNCQRLEPTDFLLAHSAGSTTLVPEPVNFTASASALWRWQTRRVLGSFVPPQRCALWHFSRIYHSSLLLWLFCSVLLDIVQSMPKLQMTGRWM